MNELLKILSKLNIKIWPEGDKLRIRASKGVLTEDICNLISEYKEDLLSFIRGDIHFKDNTNLNSNNSDENYINDVSASIDRQISINGYKIEFEEIEAAISQHPSVLNAVVMLGEDRKDGKQLIAYLLTNPGEKPAISELKVFLKGKLPNHMIPSDYMIMDIMSEFSIDDEYFLEKNYVAPRTDTEKILVHIWDEILGIKKVGIYDNFFKLGGNSILASKLISRIKDIFKMEFPFLIMGIFNTPTIVGLSEILTKYETKPGQIEKIARIHQKVGQMSPEEISSMLKDKKQKVTT